MWGVRLFDEAETAENRRMLELPEEGATSKCTNRITSGIICRRNL